MTRMALLIEASTIKNHSDLPGAREDVQSYETYLRSDFGGAWEKKEVEILRHPSLRELSAWLRAAASVDYAFITFSGHGYHAVGKKISETRLCINDTEEVSVYDLNPGNPRVLIVADACRKLTAVRMEKSAGRIAATLNEAQTRLKPNRQKCRELYDNRVQQAESGPIYMYSCDLNEAAADENSFSRELITTGEDWATQHKPGYLLSDQAFAKAAQQTTRKNAQQHPKMDAGRRLTHFPFAVFAV